MTDHAPAFGQRRISQFSYYNMSAYNLYYVKLSMCA